MDPIEERMAVLRAHLDECRQRREAADQQYRAAMNALTRAKARGELPAIAAATRRLVDASEAVRAAQVSESQARYLAGG